MKKKHAAVLLQWVVIDGNIEHVSDYAHLKPDQRPVATCPECDEPVVMKLGTKRVHHVAHTVDSKCVLTNAETALHYNCKMHIARELEKGSQLKLTEKCISCQWDKQEIIWQKNWDEVKVERKLTGGLLPDVSLWREGQPLAAIEIFVTHAVDKEKAERLSRLGVPWIEVVGGESVYLEPDCWRIDKALTAERRSYKVEWECEECRTARLKRERLEAERLARLAKEREYQERNGEKQICFKVMDVYFPSGRWKRYVFCINKVLKDGQIIEFSLGYLSSSWNYERIKYYSEEGSYIYKLNTITDQEEALEILRKEGRKFLGNQKRKDKVFF